MSIRYIVHSNCNIILTISIKDRSTNQSKMMDETGFEVDLPQHVDLVADDDDDPSIVELPVDNDEDVESNGNKPLGRPTSRRKHIIGIIALAALGALIMGIGIGVGTKQSRSNRSSAASAVTLEQCLAAEKEERTASIGEEEESESPTYMPTTYGPTTYGPTAGDTQKAYSSDEYLQLSLFGLTNDFTNESGDGPVRRRELRVRTKDADVSTTSNLVQENDGRKERLVKNLLRDATSKNSDRVSQLQLAGIASYDI